MLVVLAVSLRLLIILALSTLTILRMATPIKPTPILYGSSSKKFNEELTSGQNQKASSAERERIASLVNKVLAKSAR